MKHIATCPSLIPITFFKFILKRPTETYVKSSNFGLQMTGAIRKVLHRRKLAAPYHTKTIKLITIPSDEYFWLVVVYTSVYSCE